MISLTGQSRKIQSESSPELYHSWDVLARGRIFYTYKE
nr:MAG TPA: hypothetical protein [Caudoviricetes sp.]